MEKSPIWNNLQWLSLNFVNKKATHYQFIFNLCFKRHQMKRLLKNHTPRIPSIDHKYWTQTLFLDQSDIVILCYFLYSYWCLCEFFNDKVFLPFLHLVAGESGKRTLQDILWPPAHLQKPVFGVRTHMNNVSIGAAAQEVGARATGPEVNPRSSKLQDSSRVIIILSKINPPSSYPIPVWYFSPELGLISLLRNHQLTQTTHTARRAQIQQFGVRVKLILQRNCQR